MSTSVFSFSEIKHVKAQDWSWEGTTANWTVPYSGWYTIDVGGGQGGLCFSRCNSSIRADGGYGSTVKGDIYLTGGTTLKIVAGEAGTNNSCPRSDEDNSYDEYGGTGGSSYIQLGSTYIVIAYGGQGGNVDCTPTGDCMISGKHQTSTYINGSYQTRDIVSGHSEYYWYGMHDVNATKLDVTVRENHTFYTTAQPHNTVKGDGNGRTNIYQANWWQTTQEAYGTSYPAGNGWYWDDDDWEDDGQRWRRRIQRPANFYVDGHYSWPNNTSYSFSSSVIYSSSKPGYVKISSNLLEITPDKKGGTGGFDIVYLLPENGYTIDPENMTYTTKVSTPTRTGYIFQGYVDTDTGTNGTTQQSGSTMIIDASGNILVGDTYFEDNKTIYALWKPITYQIEYKGGSTNN
jgi:hypothetical protein